MKGSKQAVGRKVVVMGGGTGTSIVLGGLRRFDVQLSAVVSMADDGGSSGRLRRELGVLPPGDLRQCLLALANTTPSLETLFNYRFTDGAFKGHNAGNLLIAALEKSTGSLETAIDTVHEILGVVGDVIPVTLAPTALGVLHGPHQERVLGEHLIDENLPLGLPRHFFLEPPATINPRARKVLIDADAIIIGPGSLSTSLIPTLIVDGVREAINQSNAKIIYNVNLVPTPGQTDSYTVVDYLRDLQQYLPRPINVATYHNGARSIALGEPSDAERKTLQGANLLSGKAIAHVPGDPLVRSSTVHDQAALAELIMNSLD